MKKINIIPKSLILALLAVSTIFVSCTQENDAFTIGINDFNDRILTVDKEIAAPGDIITMTGTGLDEVYKIMLNDDNVPVKFTATETELKITVPASAPLGDVVTFNILFSGKGLAQRVVSLQSPPTILKVTPSAAQPGTFIKVIGIELYKAVSVFVGDTEVDFTIIDDKNLTLVLPTGFAGGAIKIISATGSESLSQNIVLGTEIIINDYDGTHSYDNGISSNGNLDLDTEETGESPRNKFWTFTIKDNATSWGGNVDFNITGLPAGYTNNSAISLSIDIKLSKAMDVNVMIARGGDVWGKTLPLVTGWQTVVLKFSDMGSGYGSTPPTDAGFVALPNFNAITGVKIQPPAGATSGNMGETISIDNISFIIVN